MTAITVMTWGAQGLGNIRINVRSDQTTIEAVCASIERRSGFVFCGGVRKDSWTGDSTVCEGTLGIRIARKHGGGYSVKGNIWFAIPGNAP